MSSGKKLGGAAVLAALVAGSPLSPGGALAASLDGQFNTAISRMLMGLKEGPVSVMSKQEKTDLVACVQKVFGGISDEKKKFILDAGDPAGIRERLDKVRLENQAKLKQQVRDDCG